MILIPTVRHTGSHFVVGLFGIDVGRTKRPHMQTGDPNEVIFEHVDTPHFAYLMRLAKKNRPIIPLRHPKVVAHSWKQRGKDRETMCRDFRKIVNHLDAVNPCYLPLDVENRQDYLDNINETFGLELKTDWGPHPKSHGNHLLRHDEFTSEPLVRDFCTEIKPFLDRFYAS